MYTKTKLCQILSGFIENTTVGSYKLYIQKNSKHKPRANLCNSLYRKGKQNTNIFVY